MIKGSIVTNKRGKIGWDIQREWHLGQFWDIYGVGMCKQDGECWCYDDYRLRKVVSELKRAWGSIKKA